MELLIVEEKLSFEQEGQFMFRYEEFVESVEEYVLDMLWDQLNWCQFIDNVFRNFLWFFIFICGYKEVWLLVVQKLEMWLQNFKLIWLVQDLLMFVCMNCNMYGFEDMDVIFYLIKICFKFKVFFNYFMLCIRELLSVYKDNLGSIIKLVIFNEFFSVWNFNNMQVFYMVLQYSFDLVFKFLVMVFQDLLINKDDYLWVLWVLLWEIIKQIKYEINFQVFCLGFMQECKELQYLEMEFKECFVVYIIDVLVVFMMLGIMVQVKEVGIVWDKGEKRNLEVFCLFQNQIVVIQWDVVWWFYIVVFFISKFVFKDYVYCLYKVLFIEQLEIYYKWDNWLLESDCNFFLCLCFEVFILEDMLMCILVIGLFWEFLFGFVDVMEFVDYLVKWVVVVQVDDVEVLKVGRIQLIDVVLNLCIYYYFENIQFLFGYQFLNFVIFIFYWKVWFFLLVVVVFNLENIGLVVWEEYLILMMFMEMVMINNYFYLLCILMDEEIWMEMMNCELQIVQWEKQEILVFEGYLVVVFIKQIIIESSSFFLLQFISLDF